MGRLGRKVLARVGALRPVPLAGDDLLWAQLENERSFRWMLPVMMGQFGVAALLPLVLLDLQPAPSEGLLPLALFIAIVGAAAGLCFGFPRAIRLVDRIPAQRWRRYPAAAESRRWNHLMVRAGVWLWAGISVTLVVGVALNPAEFGGFAIAFVAYTSTALAFHGLRGRRGRDPSCARCGYPAGPEPSQWITCPECGADLSKPIAVILGRDVRRPHLVILGALGYAAATAGFILLW